LALEHGLKPLGNPGKGTIRDQDGEQQIRDCIWQYVESKISVKKEEIKHYCPSQFQAPITRNLADSFVLRGAEETIPTKSVPQEGERLSGPRAFLTRTVQNLNEHLQEYTTEPVFNLDEVGISVWEGRRTRKVTVRGDVPPDGTSWNVSKCQADFSDCRASSRLRYSATYGDLSRHSNLSLTSELSQTDFDSTSNSKGKAQLSKAVIDPLRPGSIINSAARRSAQFDQQREKCNYSEIRRI
jgi:hypothetical protein